MKARPRIPNGTRVHHRGQIWSYGFSAEEQAARPSAGWATVVQSVPQSDGTYEYLVRRDAPLVEGGDLEGWWASYHIDAVINEEEYR